MSDSKSFKRNNYIMILATLFWSGAFIAGKYSVAEFPVLSLVFFRFLFATAIIFPIMIKTEKNWKITKEDIPVFLALGVVGMIGYHVFFFECLKYTTATNSSIIGATNPIVTTIFAGIFLKERFKSKHILSLLLSFVGVVLIVTGGHLSTLKEFTFNKGDLIMMIAVVCWSAYSVMSKKVAGKYSPIKITAYAFLFCAVIIFPFTFMENPMEFIPEVSINGWMSVLYMSCFASVCGYLIQQISIKNIGPAKTNMYINLNPVFSMILAYILLGEPIVIVKVIAAGCIIAGVLISNMPEKSK
ncbi:DMT family transporter [Peptacetobacter hominis]|uniref:DMT family transporter n=1 Tax=Peptacetobacter hominis TaxID=2743610 RepID=A0A544QVS7_9FIRM|nr:DMT family transporter [Peptacetobacter hominis]TQQ84799.1 DMT family transporter [Peptacetobacter hominis]